MRSGLRYNFSDINRDLKIYIRAKPKVRIFTKKWNFFGAHFSNGSVTEFGFQGEGLQSKPPRPYTLLKALVTHFKARETKNPKIASAKRYGPLKAPNRPQKSTFFMNF